MAYRQLQDRVNTSRSDGAVCYKRDDFANDINYTNIFTDFVCLGEPTIPWWLRFGGAAFSSSSIRWKIWQIIYFVGVWGLGILILIYVMTTENPDVFAVFVVIKDEPSELLRNAQKVVTTIFCVSHLWIHIWVLRTRWQMPSLIPPNVPHRWNKAVVIYVMILVGVMLSGNLVNPGNWSITVNVTVWGLCGAIFVWYPFMLPFAMFISECQTHKIRFKSFWEKVMERKWESRIELSKAEIKDITAHYFSLARSVSVVNSTFQLVLPLQLVNLFLALFTNITQTVVTSNMAEDDFGTDFMTISIVLIMLFQLAIPLFYATSCNKAGDRMLRAIAHYPELAVLLGQAGQWTPYIRLCGAINGFVITSKSLLYAIPLLVYYIYSVLKVVGPNLFDSHQYAP